MSTATLETPRHVMPAAWYDLAGHLSEARAVAGCILDSLPTAATEPVLLFNRINDSASLSCAVGTLLEIVQQDLDRLEAELRGRGQ